MCTKFLKGAMGAFGLVLLAVQPARAWSNRGHRLVNLIAAQSLPADMPAFMRTPQAIAEISYLGPEPDRWRPSTAPDLSRASSPDHFFRIEAGIAVSPLSRRRYDYLHHLDELQHQDPANAAHLTPQYTGTLPWQAEEIYQRLVSAFLVYRIANGEKGHPQAQDMVPLSKADLPYIEDSALFYAGWLGHYIGDGCMPLHDSINIAGWAEKSNPHHYTTSGSIHHQLEAVTDQAIEDDKITPATVDVFLKPARIISDSFAGTLSYLQTEGTFAEDVYKFQQQGALQGDGTPALDQFVSQRMAEGGGMLRDLIYSAWLQSKLPKAPVLPQFVTLYPR